MVRQAKPRGRWKSTEVPCFDPNWVLKFYLPGRPVLVKSGPADVVFPICERCLGLPLECGGVMKERQSCRCQKWPRTWAVEFLRTQTHLLMTGAIGKLEAMRRPEEWTPLPDVLTTYEVRGPSDAKKRAAYLRTIVEVATGKEPERQTWADLTKRVCFDFAELWQEAGRRGWHERGAMPPEGWSQLRAEFKAGRLAAGTVWPEATQNATLRKMLERGVFPALDTRTVMKCNTSIRNYLNAARSILGQKSRDTFLRGLSLPPLKEFLSTKIAVLVPKGHQEFTREHYLAILNGLPELRKTNPRVWLVNQMLMRFALRPEEIFPARPGWLELVRQEAEERTRINIVNRLEEGFALKAGVNAKPRHIWVPVDLLACMREVMTDASLIGGRTPTEARNLVERDHPTWLRSIGVDVERPNYKFRHFALAERMTSGDATQAAALGGHSTSATTERNYARTLGTLEPLSETEIYRRLMEG